MEQLVYDGAFKVVAREENGHRREKVVRSETVGVAAMWQGKLALVRQYRYPVGEGVWEIPAGGIEPGETPTEAAVREVREELGVEVEDAEVIIPNVLVSPGMTNERMTFVGAILASEPPQFAGNASEGERTEIRLVTAEEFDELMKEQQDSTGADLKTLLMLAISMI